MQVQGSGSGMEKREKIQMIEKGKEIGEERVISKFSRISDSFCAVNCIFAC